MAALWHSLRCTMNYAKVKQSECVSMREQMLNMKLQHLTNMGNWETGRHVKCAVYTVCTVYSTCK
jgi:hypothetical protein